ncbi:nucleotidyltransferase domain-containing protein [Streptococcus dysgalactiae]|uniref:nucleotidyltransferase domain-containing protein n=1 Tax=Streptococcus dysgalactiae TaxID=1334 RepID=UPI003A687B62
MKYSESTLQSWTSPLSETEKQRVNNTIKMIKDAISSSDDLVNCRTEIFAQGSYANNTNVRQNSDIDICVMLTSTFTCKYVDGMTDKDYGFVDGSINYADYKSYIITALRKKFGAQSVSIGNKSIKIETNTYRVNADVVPAFQYRNYKYEGSKNPDVFVEGVRFISLYGNEVINYPKKHIENGIKKNNDTKRFYKQLVRIMKRIRNNMVEENIVDGDNITSFLVECLVWNIPNDKISRGDSWDSTLRNAIVFLWETIEKGDQDKWVEVSGMYYLFNSSRKWTTEAVGV